jgi:hypothetical protein
MMRTLTLALLCIASLSRVAAANDSVWMVCEGVAKADKAHAAMFLAANVLEHRGSDGRSRVADVTLLKGGHLALGSLTTEDDGAPVAVTLVTVDKSASKMFVGKVMLNLMQGARDLALKGKLDLGSIDPFTIDVAFKCHELDDLAIGHP